MKNYSFDVFNINKLNYSMTELTKAECQYNMAVDYHSGVPQNYAQAFKYFLLSAKGGERRAQYNVGVYYLNGYGVAKDTKLALEYFEKSAEQGDVLALAVLGRLYYSGDEIDEVKQDYEKAVEFLEKSENVGPSQPECPIYVYHMLGFCHFHGFGVAQDCNKAFEYFDTGSQKGCDVALLNLGICYKNGKGVLRNNENDEYAIRCFEMSAKLGNKNAQFNAGVEYHHQLKFKKAREYYEQSAKQGHILSNVHLGMLYYYGYGVPVDYAKALEYFHIGLKQNNDVAQWMLGICYRDGHGVAQNPAKGLEYFELSAKQGNEYAKQSIERVMLRK